MLLFPLCSVVWLKHQLWCLRLIIDSSFLRVSDTGLVWAWGYGGEGQLGLGSRIRMVSTPHLVPCIDSSYYVKDRSATLARGNMDSEGQTFRVPGSYIKRIACGGRHSAVITGTYVSVYSATQLDCILVTLKNLKWKHPYALFIML